MKSITCLYIFYSENFSGAEIVISRLLKSNHSITPIILCSEGDFASFHREAGLKVYTSKHLSSARSGNIFVDTLLFVPLFLFKSLALSITVSQIIKQHKEITLIDCINLIPSFYILPYIFYQKIYGRNFKIIRSHHDISFHGRNKYLSYWIWNLLARNFDLNYVPSGATRKKFLQVTSHNAWIVYNGIDIQKFNNLKIHTGVDITVGIIGQIIPEKGHMLLLEAMKELRTNKSVKLFVYGNENTDFSVELKKYISTISALSEMVEFKGFIKETEAIYNEIDIVVNCTTESFAEPLGTTIIEGMSYGKIVVASNVGGTPEIIDDKLNGYLYQSTSLKNLQSTLEYVVDNCHKLIDLRENAILKVSKKFNIDVMVNNYNKMVLDILDE
ncbi:MAG: glycosyltransferase involved in cell wall biosynthesis [Spirosomataceae bacterium]|jgi:glycosyltransferase involved in cell wall biosynthesis